MLLIAPYKRALGQALNEYVICGCLVLLVCIVGIQLASGNINSWFSFLREDMQSHIKAADSAQQSHVSQATALASAPQQTQNEEAPLDPESLHVDPAEAPSDTVQVAGGNGAEKLVGDIMSQAKDALASGNLTQEEYDAVMKLANKGHDIAMIQGLLENAGTQSNGNSSAYANTSLTFNGKTYTPAELNSTLESNISEFSDLKSKAAVLNGVLYTPSLLSTIDSSGAQIINNGFAYQQQNQTADSFLQYQSEGITGGATDTHGESATICTTGGNQDSGTACSN